MKVDAALLDYMPDTDRRELEWLLSMLPVWEPDNRNQPQCIAAESEAFEVLYGGAVSRTCC
jgi:hypothetical protein